MSKTVTAVSKAVMVGGNALCLASDGTVRHVSLDTKKGGEVQDFEIALTRDGIRAVLKAAPLMAQIADAEKKLRAIKTGAEGDLGDLVFEGQNGEIAVTVGCTSVSPEELPGYLKALGLKR